MRRIYVDYLHLKLKSSRLLGDQRQVLVAPLLFFVLATSVIGNQLKDQSFNQQKNEENKQDIDLLYAGLNKFAFFNLGRVFKLLVEVGQFEAHFRDDVGAVVVLVACDTFTVPLHINLLQNFVQRVGPMQLHHILVDPKQTLLA